MERGEVSIRLVIIIFFSFVLSVLKAQPRSGNPSPSAEAGFSYNISGDCFTSNVPLNEIKPLAFRRFIKSFPQAGLSHWLKTASGYSVYFKKADSVLYRVSYNQKGELVKEYVTYSGDAAPADVQEIVHSHYPGYRIKMVSEMNDGITDYYGILIIRGDSAKTLELLKGELDLLAQFHSAGLTRPLLH